MDSDSSDTGIGRRTPRERALVPVLVFLGMVVAVISSLGAPLVPTIAVSDHVSLSDAQWSLTITLLVGAVATPTMGRLGDGPRRRQVIIGAAAVVLLGSVLAALPLGFGFLVLGRGLQGVGLGLTPLAIATARDSLPTERARPAVALLSITTVAGVGLGYPLTGLIAQSFGVHAGFWFGAAISALALAAVALVLPSTGGRAKHPLDVLGAVLLGAAIAGLLLVLSEGDSWGWGSPRLLALAAAAIALAVWWTLHELRTVHPLVDLRLARHPVVLTADVTGLIAGIGMYLLMSLVTRFVQTPATAGYGFGASIVVTGLVLLPFSVASVLSSKVVPVLARRTSSSVVLPVGCAVSLLSMLAFAFARHSLWELFATMAIAGLGVGCTFAVMPGLIVSSVPAHETGSAISFNQVLRYVGYSTGSALSAAMLQAHTPAGQLLPTGSGYQSAALLGCAVWVVTGAVTIVLLRRGASAAGAGQVVAGVEPDEELLMDESIADAATAEEIPSAAGPRADLGAR
ncbi:putative MFS family arabinose efflux permease [Kitasatospora sp. MAP12-15]|uniref:MFS transporter n=1 Tax=unclassified Kitasatospora TaxID=2633591 RepID=UPI002475384C|nr:MFS transporter [Kitasatospora sp. MAP12-44]MDH6113836.1 putative MFS family arabinose efflux permease [Kitasatospora sp. MAP12-44]